ncbi:carbohydrate porin, partial [Bradyrhizobium sp. Tv2a-2]|uniref:carbohydrate porin n=1 Tax=Bradyrhizobium sp. Tv2a-2 TaxID=113395 RepID=UPI001FD8D0B4
MRVEINSTGVASAHLPQNDQMKPPYSAAGSGFCFRRARKQKGLVIALALATSIAASPALAQNANMSNLTTDTPDEVAKRTIQKKEDPLAKRTEMRAVAAIASSALARTTSLSKPRSDSPDVDPFAKFENLREKGTVLTVPGPADTIDQDKGGVRSALAEVGIGYVGWTQNTFVNNLLPNAAKSTIANQLYNGQNPTFNTVNAMMVTYDLSRFGVPDGQIIVGTEQQWWTWNPGGPDRIGLATFAFYQTFFDRKLEFKIGYLRNSYEFAGIWVGGNAGANVFGPSGNILYQGGIGNNAAPTPGIILKFNAGDQLYSKASLQRSISPDGVFTEVTQNPTGLTWSTPNTGVLLLDEVGYQNKAARGSPDTWLRAGAGFNNSNYTNLEYPKQPRADENSFYYVAADRQVWQTNADSSPSRGIYGGFSVMYAPPDLNKVSQYYELRLYVKGPFDWRPSDQISVVATDTAWSKYSVESALAAGNLVHWESKAISGTYTAHLAPGIYANIGLSYIDNPTSVTYTPKTGHALNFSASTT